MRHNTHPALIICVLLALVLTEIGAVIGLPLPGGLPNISIPVLDRLFKEDPPVTSSLADAVTEIDYLDDYNPNSTIPLGLLRQVNQNTIHLFPGVYSYEAQSYCLHAGTYAPGRGEGYLLAPLKGPKASIVRSILQRSAQHPEIPQSNIQLLLWAIIARTKYDDMAPQLRDTGSKLLTPDEIGSLNGGTLGVIPAEVRARAFADLPGPVRQVYEAENQIRSLLTQTSVPFAEVERVAVLQGSPPAEGGPEVPRGRWSYTPDGYFVRYEPDSYRHTHVEVSVPDNFTVQRDSLGRITQLTNGRNDRIELAYDDRIAPVVIPGDSDVKAFALKSVTLVFGGGQRILDRKQWSGLGWTFVGVPNGSGQPDTSVARFDGLATRYQAARANAQQFEQLVMKIGHRSVSRDGLQLLVDLASLRTTVETSLRRLASGWTSDDLDLGVSVWQAAFSAQVGGPARITDLRPYRVAFDPQRSVGPIISQGEASGTSYDPSGGVAMPGNTARQRLAQSWRCGGTNGAGGAAGDFQRAVATALRHHGANINAQEISVQGSWPGPLTHFFVRIGHNNNALPSMECLEQGIAAGQVSAGSLEGAKSMLIGTVQTVGNQTRVYVRVVDVATGVITDSGAGTATGTNASAVQQATDQALSNAGLRLH